MTEKEQFLRDLDFSRKNLLKYSRKAFQMIPEMKEPSILDIGCGSGVPAMELARLSDGKIIGVDINQAELDRFEEKIKKADLADRVSAVKGSLFNLSFEEEIFDIIWAEGSIWVIGFEKIAFN